MRPMKFPPKAPKSRRVPPGYLDLGRGGLITLDRIVAVARANSAPVKRLLEAAGPARVLNLTYGEPRQSVIVLDNGYLAVVTPTPETLMEMIDAIHSSHDLAATS